MHSRRLKANKNKVSLLSDPELQSLRDVLGLDLAVGFRCKLVVELIGVVHRLELPSGLWGLLLPILLDASAKSSRVFKDLSAKMVLVVARQVPSARSRDCAAPRACGINHLGL